jgi:hypothetical protein
MKVKIELETPKFKFKVKASPMDIPPEPEQSSYMNYGIIRAQRLVCFQPSWCVTECRTH